MSTEYRRPMFDALRRRMTEPRRFIQVVAGARQVGKTTLVRQVVETSGMPAQFASADEPGLKGREWLAMQWEAARLRAGRTASLLVVDEVQKIDGWAETVKRLWDEDTQTRRKVKVILLGSAPLLHDHDRWSAYVRDALIETSISRDVLLLTRVDKPALLRRFFEIGCQYSGQILSYTKIVGQLQDAGIKCRRA